MVQRFLKAQHWQLFLLTFGMAMVFQFIFVGSMISNMATRQNPDPQDLGFLNSMKFFPIIMLLFVSVFFGWFWSVVTGLQANLPDEIKMKLTRFKIFFFIPIIYMVFILVYMGIVFSGLMSETGDVNPAAIGGLIAFIIPLHLFSMFCMFHTLYYAAKTLKMAEIQRTVSFSDFSGEFFLIWFFPIGIWIIQPRINKLVENKMPIK
ncbi:MAG TPA: hypothetical protein VK796_01380 [Cytophaga sp.]|jgi:hypothetical protein|nr:hypothetical protein [Cytophaga sp.]